MEIINDILLTFGIATAATCLGTILVGVLVAVMVGRLRPSAWKVTPEVARHNLDRLLTQHSLQPLQLEQAEWLRGSFGHQVVGSAEKWFSQVGLNNAEGRPALLAAGVLKNYKPFKGWIVSRFDQHELEIVLQPTPEYLFYLDGHLIGCTPFPGLLRGQVDYICDAERAPVLWHDRPLFHIVGITIAGLQLPRSGMKYVMYADPAKQVPVAEVSRAGGRGSIDYPTLGSTGIHFLQPLPLEQKALILGFLLIDLLFNV